jgi:hypothetical protein
VKLFRDTRTYQSTRWYKSTRSRKYTVKLKDGENEWGNWKDDQLEAVIDWEDEVVTRGLRSRSKYARLVSPLQHSDLPVSSPFDYPRISIYQPSLLTDQACIGSRASICLYSPEKKSSGCLSQ